MQDDQEIEVRNLSINAFQRYMQGSLAFEELVDPFFSLFLKMTLLEQEQVDIDTEIFPSALEVVVYFFKQCLPTSFGFWSGRSLVHACASIPVAKIKIFSSSTHSINRRSSGHVWRRISLSEKFSRFIQPAR